jgi:lipopolysaccharide export system protein LptA
MKIVDILNDDSYHFAKIDSLTEITTLVGHVKVRQEKTIIDCDSLIMNPRADFIECFGNVHINDDSTDIYSDYMKYEVGKKTVHFLRKVRLTDGKGLLTTEDLQYDLNTKIGTYDHGGRVKNKESILTSEQAVYFETTKDVLFRKNVVLRDPQYDLSADSLRYNTQTQVSTFITETLIVFKDSTHRTVVTRDGYYDLKNKKAWFGQRPVITDGSQRITGDTVEIDDSTGTSLASGSARYQDTAQGVAMEAGRMFHNQKTNTFLGTANPLLILKQEREGDSIYIRADTLYSGRLIDAEAMQRKTFVADSLHRIYVDSLLKLSEDSMRRVAAARDSLKRRADTSLAQITADSIHVKDRSDSTGRSALRFSRVDSLGRPLDSLGRPMAPPLHVQEARPSSPVAGKSPPTAPTAPAPPGSRAAPPLAKKTDTVLKKTQPSPQPLAKAKPAVEKPAFVFGAPDSTYQAASSTLPTKDSTLRYILGYHHVRIYSDSLQAVADSLYYAGKDSIFRLYKDPIAWGNGDYQITGDTMYVYTKNKKASRLYVFENALAINKVGRNFYNQLKGTTINGYFKNGEIDYLRAKGNSESIYYLRDDSNAFSGVNKAHADIIDMIFADKAKDDTAKAKGRELNRVVLRNNAEGSMMPIRRVNFDEMKLRGFKWQDSRRPKSKSDIMQPVVLPADLTKTPQDLPDSSRKNQGDPPPN